jgi:hypothetical protein
MEFAELVKEILVTEHCRTKEEADALVKQFPQVMVNAITAGPRNYRAAAMALEMAESAGRDAPFDPDARPVSDP